MAVRMSKRLGADTWTTRPNHKRGAEVERPREEEEREAGKGDEDRIAKVFSKAVVEQWGAMG
jgi:hypothetical protein